MARIERHDTPLSPILHAPLDGRMWESAWRMSEPTTYPPRKKKKSIIMET